MNEDDYRTRIYKDYATRFQDAGSAFDGPAATRWGKAYDHYFRGWLPEGRNAAIAELACGGGRLLHFFLGRDYRNLVGVDISPSQVRLARQVVEEVREMDSIEFLEANPSTFDLVVGLDIIEHFHKPEVLLFLDSCHSSLKSGGRLILQTPNGDSPWCGTSRYNDFTHETCFNPNAITRLLSLCGFGNIEVRETGPVPFGYSTFSTFRFLAWQGIRAGLMLANLVETGDSGSRVFTRNFLATGVKG